MLIPCPVCGLRDHEEFTYFGDATVERPALDSRDAERWAAYIYDRRNPRGPHQEYWHHVHGCRQWMVVARDTATHDVGEVRLVGPWAEKELEGRRPAAQAGEPRTLQGDRD
jgi:sarcosine oxidase subunit delta